VRQASDILQGDRLSGGVVEAALGSSCAQDRHSSAIARQRASETLGELRASRAVPALTRLAEKGAGRVAGQAAATAVTAITGKQSPRQRSRVRRGSNWPDPTGNEQVGHGRTGRVRVIR
jgi:hypothetical protein